MKKKIIAILIIAGLFIGLGNVDARTCVKTGEGYVICGDGASALGAERTLTDGQACQFGRYNRPNLNAVRLTVVDKNGNRVSGSADFYSGSLPGFYSRTRVSTEKKTRNEIISSSTGYTTTGSRPYINAWSKLPSFTGSDYAAPILRTYFINNFASLDYNDMMWIFGLLGYDGYQNELLYENHYLMIEPIFQFSTDTPISGKDGCAQYETIDIDVYNCAVGYATGARKNISDVLDVMKNALDAKDIGCPQNKPTIYNLCDCDLSHTYYYGTATEIFSMMKQSNDPLLTYKYGQGGSIETITRNVGGLIHDDENVAGLLDASGLLTTRTGAYPHILDNYGLGSMHIWMKYILQGCPNGECTTVATCPDGTPVPEDGVCAEATPSTCSYTVTSEITNDCTEGQTGVIEDGATWQCVFEAIDAPKNSYQGEFYYPQNNTEFVGNPYCNVACKESVKYMLPSTFEEVAGRRFSIGVSNEYGSTSTLSPNIIVGTTTCSTAYLSSANRTPMINYPQFVLDYKAANTNVNNAWNNLQSAIAKEKAFQAASVASTSSGNHEQCLEKKTVPVQVGSQLMGPYGPADQASCDACSALIGSSCCSVQPVYENREVYKSWEECSGDSGYEHGHSTYDVYNWSGSYTWYGGTATVSYTTTSCGGHGPTKDSVWAGIQNEISAARTAYNNAVTYRDNLLKMINMCNNYQRTYSEFSPKLSFAYSETKYKGSYELTSTVQITSKTDYLVNNNIVETHQWSTVGYESSSSVYKYDMTYVGGNKGYTDRYDCSGELTPCALNVNATVYPANISAINVTTKTYNYELPSNANRYVAKNGKSYNTANEAELSDYPYLDTGRSNMPVNYETLGGWYHYYYEYYYANGTANLFGTNQKFLKYNMVEPGGTSSYNGLTIADNLTYHCIYKINCGMLECPEPESVCPDGSDMPANGKCPGYTIEHKICPSGVPMPISGKCPDGGGLNIIYRTISLNDPFPGEHGEGRDSGANWDGTATVLGTKMSFIDAYITNNRGVTTEDVYQETPMYQFTLTPANIRAIRKYNRSTGNDYNDYNFECSNGKYCKSEFLEEGIGNGYFGFSSKNPNGGSCFNAYSTDWESCRYSSIGG